MDLMIVSSRLRVARGMQTRTSAPTTKVKGPACLGQSCTSFGFRSAPRHHSPPSCESRPGANQRGTAVFFQVILRAPVRKLGHVNRS